MKPLLVLLFICFAGFAIAQENPKGTHDDVAAKIEQKILAHDKISIDNLKVLHQGNSIYLEGVAEQYGSYYYAEKIAQDFEGIETVDNQIGVRTKDTQDAQIESELIGRINKHLSAEPFDLVSFKVSNGMVTLLGSVRDQGLKEKVFEEAIWIRGVRNVENKIHQASISPADDRLRVGIRRTLAASFPQYFHGRRPAIIILVEHGRVTLVGSVSSNSDKERILSAVRSFVGVVSVEDRLEVG